MDEPLYTSDAAHLRAQLAALAEEHETLAANTRIVEANLKALVEKVKAYEAAVAPVLADHILTDAIADALLTAEQAMIDLARSLDV